MSRSLLLSAFLVVSVTACTSPREEARDIARQPAACTTPDDCCRVVDGCMAQVLVVSASDRDRVQNLINGSDQTTCLDCMTPLVQVDCVDGQCSAEEIDPQLWIGATVPQCGRATVPANSQTPLRSAGGDLSTSKSKLILGCGT